MSSESPGFKSEFKHEQHGAEGSHEMSHKKSDKAGVRQIMTGSPEEQEKHGLDRASHDCDE